MYPSYHTKKKKGAYVSGTCCDPEWEALYHRGQEDRQCSHCYRKNKRDKRHAVSWPVETPWGDIENRDDQSSSGDGWCRGGNLTFGGLLLVPPPGGDSVDTSGGDATIHGCDGILDFTTHVHTSTQVDCERVSPQPCKR